LNIGQTIGDYEIIGLIGSGGMGTVYRVRHAISDRVEAMKVILPNLRDAPELLERFQREIKIQASLSHPNIASLYTAQRHGDQFLMFLEFVEGTSLHDRIEQGPLELSEAVDYIRQVLSALAYAHERGVNHRDVKPRNILITREGVVKLTDFGIATSAAEKNITKTGAAVGSLNYMSPEQVKGGRGDARSDIYSTGVMLYELTVGKRPFDADSDYGIMAAHLHQTPVLPSELRPDLPSSLSRAIMQALEKDPANRFQTANQFREALETSGSEVRNSGTPWDATVLDKIRREFATYIGPMARILVDRMAKRAHTLDELYRLLAAEIPSDSDRAKFLAARPRTH
jgi:serine/threonine protein kinase